jgi:hypothetical protein
MTRRGRGGAYRLLVGRTERKRPPGRPKFRWEDTIIIDLKEILWVGWI